MMYYYSLRETEHGEQHHGSELINTWAAQTSSLGGTIPCTPHIESYLRCAKEGDKYNRLAPL